MNRMVVAAAVVIASSSGLQASIVYTSQNRFVTARAEAALGTVVDTHTITAPDFGPFDASVSAEAIDPIFMVSGFGRASQHSTLDPLGFEVNGDWSGGRTGQGASGGGTSSFSIAFTLAEPLDYTFTVSAIPGLFYMFTGPDGFTLTELGTFTGVLQPGEYFVSAAVSGSAGFPPSGGGFAMELIVVPGPGGVILPVLGLAGLRRRRGW